MTELEAVNIMLSTIGQVPVADIPDSGRSDARIAANVLSEYTVELQTEGYDFNTFEAFEVTPSSSGTITFGPSVIRVKNSENYPRIGLKGQTLYNYTDQTSVFEDPVKVDIVQIVGFESLPATLQRYAIIRSARVFGNRVLGAGEINAYTGEDEARARVNWLNTLAEDTRMNVLSSRDHVKPRSFTPHDAIRRI